MRKKWNSSLSLFLCHFVLSTTPKPKGIYLNNHRFLFFSLRRFVSQVLCDSSPFEGGTIPSSSSAERSKCNPSLTCRSPLSIPRPRAQGQRRFGVEYVSPVCLTYWSFISLILVQFTTFVQAHGSELSEAHLFSSITRLTASSESVPFFHATLVASPYI